MYRNKPKHLRTSSLDKDLDRILKVDVKAKEDVVTINLNPNQEIPTVSDQQRIAAYTPYHHYLANLKADEPPATPVPEQKFSCGKCVIL